VLAILTGGVGVTRAEAAEGGTLLARGAGSVQLLSGSV